ncbi:hypothetical protein SAMN06295984_1451 [Sphingopyxis terrae subsp. ummariensis]|uniref:Uncharacterized protein n=1 Tax=Sphingopyxis terrae subsp. ummariensis TaxID=429001 RepID=A0A1Y6EVE4_9SPHN|nr:hypothetical protein SAMN06295984_1451 [Sphingopyxis terrae subsp. ummariensis]
MMWPDDKKKKGPVCTDPSEFPVAPAISSG